MAQTLGPWRVVKNPYRETGWFVLAGEAPENMTVSASIVHCSISQGQFRNESDARLVSAAPDLLATLKETVKWIDSADTRLANRDEARAVEAIAEAAIAKAEGR